MSCVTDVVFVLPGIYSAADQEYCARFEASFHKANKYEILPQEGGGGKAMSTVVYMTGVNWISREWVAEIVAAEWPTGTVLWLDYEGVMDDLGRVVVHQLGPVEDDEEVEFRGRW